MLKNYIRLYSKSLTNNVIRQSILSGYMCNQVAIQRSVRSFSTQSSKHMFQGVAKNNRIKSNNMFTIPCRTKVDYDEEMSCNGRIRQEIVKCTEKEKKDILQKGAQKNIRNFSIIAHVDHGKSSLANCMMEMLGSITTDERESGLVLDSLEVERARGITVKAQTASLFYRKPGTEEGDLENSYLLNLIDCPGHVDFAYEVSRSLSACDAALLLVDASQGVQAQTLANFYIALEHDLEIIPVMTKVDLPNADPERVMNELVSAFGCDPSEVLVCSSKTGDGVADIFDELINRIPPPNGKALIKPGEPDSLHETQDTYAHTRALIFDSWYDVHRGVVCLVMCQDGEIHKSDMINTFHENYGPYEVLECGVLTPVARTDLTNNVIRTGQVGYVVAQIKSTKEVRLGDTFYAIPRQHICLNGDDRGKLLLQYSDPRKLGLQEIKKRMVLAKEKVEPLPGFMPAKSMVFAGIFPDSESSFEDLANAVEKLLLNDASVNATKENSGALGSGYRCGFLGMLHMDVFVTRLEQEFGVSVITTAPTVPYIAHLEDGSVIEVDSPAFYPPVDQIEHIEEPMVKVSIITPPDYVGALTQLCTASRGLIEDVRFIGEDRAHMRYLMPLSEVVVDFYQEIKSLTSGYASLDYELAPSMAADVIKLEIRINGEPVDALSTICHRQKAEELGKRMLVTLKENIDRENFEIVLQCAIGNKILGRERLAPYRKDVLIKSGKLVGGGDISRKKKLLEKQKEGKKKLRAIGNVSLSSDAFLSVLKAQSKHHDR